MAFRGPSREYPAVTSGYERTMSRYGGSPGGGVAGGGGRALSVGTDIMENDLRQDSMRGELERTPGITYGGSTDPEAQSFRQFGRQYSYSPTEAAVTQGRAQAQAQVEADKVRYNALLNTAGITPRQASRLVYGRGDILDTDPTEVRSATAAYTRDPSREMAARAIQVGAAPGQFPERFQDVRRGASGGEMSLRMQDTMDLMPVQQDQFEQQEATRSRYNMQEKAYDEQLRQSEQLRPKWQVVVGANGEIGRVDVNSPQTGGKVEWSDQKTAPKRAPKQMDYFEAFQQAKINLADQGVTQPTQDQLTRETMRLRQGGAAPATGAPASSPPPAGGPAAPKPAPAPASVPAVPSAAAPQADGGDPGTQSAAYTPAEKEAAFRSLMQRGIQHPTAEQIREEISYLRAQNARNAGRRNGR